MLSAFKLKTKEICNSHVTCSKMWTFPCRLPVVRAIWLHLIIVGDTQYALIFFSTENQVNLLNTIIIQVSFKMAGPTRPYNGDERGKWASRRGNHIPTNYRKLMSITNPTFINDWPIFKKNIPRRFTHSIIFSCQTKELSNN